MMPNFLVVGAAKSGTTSLYHYLGQHLEVYVSPVKEPNFFALEGEKPDFRAPQSEERINSWSVTDLESYEELFDGVTTEKAAGEASPFYLYSEKAVGRIRHHVPEAKLVVVLRDPVQRAYSSFLHLKRNGREPLEDFGEALAAEEGRIRDNWEWIWHYKNMGFYHAQLERYHEAFEPEQLRVYLYEDLKEDPVGMLQDVYGFLGVDASFVPDVSLKHKTSGVPKSRLVYSILKKPHPAKTVLKPLFSKRFRKRTLVGWQNKVLARPPLPEEARRQLAGAYAEDVSNLQELIGRDLSHWLR